MVTINQSIYNVGNNDGYLTLKEWEDWLNGQNNPNATVDVYGTQLTVAQLKQLQLKDMIVSAGTPPTADDTKTINKFGEYVAKQFSAVKTALEDLKKQIADKQKLLDAEADKNSDKAKKLAAQIKILKGKEKNAKKQYEKVLKQYEAKFGPNAVKGKAKWWTLIGKKPPFGVTDPNAPDGTGNVAFKMQKSTGKGQSGQSGSNNSGKAQTGGTGNNPVAGGGWGKAMTGPKFSTTAYANSLFMESSIMQAWDGINSNSNRGRQMMMMLFYFMRMAMSGDLFAMYQMVNAVLHIVAKDMSLRNITISQKIIEQQQMARQATDALLNFKPSSSDQNGIEFTKMLQKTKAETDSIATSQKLMAQMMEEFAQVVETLTNVAKGLLDAAGRVQKTVSMIR